MGKSLEKSTHRVIIIKRIILQGITLLVEDNDELAQFYRLNLKVWVGANVKRVSSIKGLEKFVQQEENIDLIISKSTFSPIVQKVLELDSLSNIAHIDIGTKNFEGYSVESGLDIKPLIQSCAKALGVTASDMAKLEVPEYFPIDLPHFAVLKTAICRVFKKGKSRHGLAFEVDEPINREKLVQLKKEGHDTLFVHKVDRLRMVTNINQEIATKIDMDVLNPAEALAANEMAHELLQFKLRRIGITPETTALANKSIKNMVAASKKFPKLKKLMGRLIKNKAGYLFKHSQIMMYVCSHLMDHMEWGSEEQKKTINFVAFFHDIVLENDEQAMIHSEEDLKSSRLDQREKDLVMTHAQKSAEVVVKFPSAPMGADVIVRQHHGVPHGVGFSQTYGGNLSPMTIVFILAEDFVDHLIKSGTELNVEEKITEMRERFPTQRFKKIIDVLETVTL